MKPQKLTKIQDHLQGELKNPQFAESYAVELFKAKIARELVAARIQGKLTQEQLAGKVGVSQQQISKIENGEFESIDTVMKVLFLLKHRATFVFPPEEVPLHQHA